MTYVVTAKEHDIFELPKLRVSFGFENDPRFLSPDESVAEFFDVKFCPYQPLDQDAVFAAVSRKHVFVCKLSKHTGDLNPCEIIRVIRDEDCLDVNDLTTSPTDPSVIASASDDTSVRIWSIDPVHRAQPCLCIFAGEGHSWSLLSVAFHDNGNYILSSGHDQVINLWTVPDLPSNAITTPYQVHYPHFSTSAVHGGIVDCVAFFGDYILSRACHDNIIVLWRIEGFSSDGPKQPQSTAPTPQHVLSASYEDPDRLTRTLL
ncbi:hypothetical protein E4U59_007301 [Claviceps monticola]|nr:hypothetical protein E4U59_007301 [Claviceps monticola]